LVPSWFDFFAATGEIFVIAPDAWFRDATFSAPADDDGVDKGQDEGPGFIWIDGLVKGRLAHLGDRPYTPGSFKTNLRRRSLCASLTAAVFCTIDNGPPSPEGLESYCVSGCQPF
jgi:hypothetical protein